MKLERSLHVSVHVLTTTLGSFFFLSPFRSGFSSPLCWPSWPDVDRSDDASLLSRLIQNVDSYEGGRRVAALEQIIKSVSGATLSSFV